jgi:hypothetical protein
MKNIVQVKTVLTDDDVDTIINNSTFQEKLDEFKNSNTNMTTFYLKLENSIIEKIKINFNIDICGDILPFKLIKGDSSPHKDQVINGNTLEFKHTFLIYLNDNSGQLQVNNNNYEIKKGLGYIFPSDSIHGTIDNTNQIRMILGPMNENLDILGLGFDTEPEPEPLISIFVYIALFLLLIVYHVF